MSAVIIRPAEPEDFSAIHALVKRAFGRTAEADLVGRLRADGDIVLELVAERAGAVRGHITFSRLLAGAVPAVALAPVAVDPEHQREGIGAALIEDAHLRLTASGETLSLVLGDPAYYGRFGYSHERAAAFDSDYQCDALQALELTGGSPRSGRLAYARAFAAL